MKPSYLFSPIFAAALVLATPLAIAKPPTPHITFSGGDGSTMEKAVIMKGGTEETGVHAEYDYLAKHFPGYKMIEQSLLENKGRSYDLLKFNTADGKEKAIYFDITAFFGK